MERQYYLDLAAQGLRMPVGADLVLREKADAADILLDGVRLGQVIEEAARQYRTPLAFPLMDLSIEKAAIAAILGIPEKDAATFHLNEAPGEDVFEKVAEATKGPRIPRMQATQEAVAYIAEKADLLPIGMSIGPFSLMTKLLADPITPIYLSGMGLTAEEEPEIGMVEAALKLAETVIDWSLRGQAEAGAKAVFICEPAANVAYFSPKQLDGGSDIYERYVMQPNLRMKAMLDELAVDLIFHNCGELTNGMVEQFARLRPVVISLGSSRNLWEDAALVPNDIVLYGNLPSKQFYSDDLVSVERAKQLGNELLAKMKATGHPFILGSECDVLSVPGAESKIKSKVEAFLSCHL